MKFKYFPYFAVLCAVATGQGACSSSTPNDTNTLLADGGVDGSSGGANVDGATPASDASADGALGTGCDGIDLAPPTQGAGVQFQIPLSLGSGQEREVCQLVKINQDIDVNYAEGIMTDGSHHALVYTTGYNGTIPGTTLDGQTLDGTQVHTCSTPSALWDVKSVIAGSRHVSGGVDSNLPKGTLPPNVAFKVKAGDYLLLNFHLLNPSSEALNACYKVNLNGVPDSQVTTEAGTIFWYNAEIAVPANSPATARMACPITQDISLASAVSHAHMRLVNYTASLLTGDPESASTTKVQDLYTGTEWDLPAPKVFPQPVALKKGQWIDYHCDYQNLEARNVAQGLQTTDEMCMFIGAYWPRDPNLDYCVYQQPTDGGASATSRAGFGGRIYGNGTKSGADFLSCFWENPFPSGPLSGGGPTSSDARYASTSCTEQTCTKASAGIAPYIGCLTANGASCQAQCTNLQGSFQAICASTPASSVSGPDGGATSAKDGCKAEYGTDGTDGTCAQSGQTQAIAGCTTPVQKAELTKQCEQTFCSAACSPDAGGAGDAGNACAACVGQFTGSTADPTCLNQLTLACVGSQTKTNATACVTQCFTDCITTRATSCTVDCLNNQACKTEYQTVGGATCN